MKKTFTKVTAMVLAFILLFGSAVAGIGGIADVLDTISVRASAATVDDLIYETNNGEITITGYNESLSGALVIPSEINGVPVTAIKSYAFSNSKLTQVAIPSSIKEMGDYAFANSNLLRTVNFPNNLKSISSNAFINCSALSNVTIPESVTTIGSWAFNNCDALTKITIPASVSEIQSRAFEGCDSLKEVVFSARSDDQTIIIGKAAFNECKSLSKINLQDSNALSIGDYSFQYCEDLSDITIPETAAIIGYCAFDRCYSLSSLSISEGVLSIGDFAFQYCESLTTAVIPNSVTNIGIGSFSCCVSLINIDFGSIKTISVKAFAGCTGLKNLVIPEGVTSIESTAFSNCSGLITVTIPDSVTNIGGDAFGHCSKLTSIIIPDSVTNIGYSAFYGCNNIKKIYLSRNVVNIGQLAFSFTALTDVYYGGSNEAYRDDNITFGDFNDTLLNAEWHYGATGIPETYTLTYNANGGSGAPSNQTSNGNITLSTVKPTRSGYAFLGWATISNATTAQYQPGATYNLTANSTLYAVWKQNPVTYILTYNANGGSGAPANQTGNGNITLSAVSPKRNDYTFLGWATISNATTAQYQPGATYNLIANSALYAVWQKNETPGTDDVSKAKITAPTGTKEITWKYKAHITATATDLPKGYKVVWYEGETAVCENGDFTTDSLTANHTYTAKIVDGSGEIFSTSAQEKTVTIKVKTDFFSKLISFFAILFGGGLTDIK